MSELPQAKKSLGQHWLNDPGSLKAMCAAANINAEDTVVEIGPGQGSLTRYLLRQAKDVVAIEFDEALADKLPRQLSADNLIVINQDILKFDFTALPADYKVVANIPYYLTSNLIRVLSESSNPPSVAVLLVQKEVAERVTAVPGKMSLLSVSAQFYWEASLGRMVSANLFEPAPKVDSQILILKRRAKPLFSDIEPKKFFRIVKAGFSSRRKTLHNSLSGGLHLSKPETLAILEAAGIDPGVRAQELSLDDWHRLYIYITITIIN